MASEAGWLGSRAPDLIGRNLVMALCATAYVGAIGFSVADLLRDPPSTTYVIVPDGDWAQCVEIRATSERMAQREVLRRPALARAADDCPVLPAITAVEPRLMFARGFNALLFVSAILAALWVAGAAIGAWRESENSRA